LCKVSVNHPELAKSSIGLIIQPEIPRTFGLDRRIGDSHWLSSRHQVVIAPVSVSPPLRVHSPTRSPYYIPAAITAQSPNPYCINNKTDRDRICIPAGRTPRGTNSLTQSHIVCFRLDDAIDHRISRVIGSRYSNRSRFIRSAIELLLAKEEGQARLHDAQMAIRWG
jgi:hypothetical protein